MSTSPNEDPVSMEPISKETGLVRRSEFLTTRVKRLARQVMALDIAEGPGPRDAIAYNTRGLSRFDLGQYDKEKSPGC